MIIAYHFIQFHRKQAEYFTSHSAKGRPMKVVLQFFFCWLITSSTAESSMESDLTVKELLNVLFDRKYYVTYLIFDVGISRTQLFLYKFSVRPYANTCKLVETTKAERAFDLMNYFYNSNEVLRVMQNLLYEVKDRAPKENWKLTLTSVVFPKELENLHKNNLLKMKEILSDYLARKRYSTKHFFWRTMSNEDKSALNWWLMQFVLEVLKEAKEKNRAVVDISKDYTGFALPIENSTLQKENFNDVYNLQVLGSDYKMFVKSFNDSGLSNARIKILEEETDPCKATKFESSCIFPGAQFSLHRDNKTFLVLGREATSVTNEIVSGVDFGNCEKLIKKVVAKFEPVPKLGGKNLGVTEEFYQRFLSSSSDLQFGTLNSLKSAAIRACQNENKEDPFLCMDMVYTLVLLRDHYGVLNTDKFQRVTRIPIDWTLSVAYCYLKRILK